MGRFSFFYIVLLAVLFASCASRTPISMPTPKQEINLHVGIIADTQITTENRTSGYLFRNMRTDALVNVAIRTSAQEHLAAEHLGYMLKLLAKDSPDIILYLGDATNSGCEDEMLSFMNVMNSFRKESNIPIFLTVGNHDYLATGNQSNVSARKQACGDQSFFTKRKLSKLFSDYNLESSKIVNANSDFRISSFIDVMIDNDSDVPLNCESIGEEDQQISGCYYAGLVELSSNNSNVKLLLVDTSDYSDVKVLPKLSEYFAFFGLRGSVSWNYGQTDWFEKHLNDSDSIRIISSHYPVTNLGWTRLYVSRPGDLMTKNGYNLWLSAHTHAPFLNKDGEAINYGSSSEGYKTVQHLNVGSTTDFKPHAAIVSMSADSVTMDKVESMTSQELSVCKENLYADYTQAPEIVEEILGLTKAYRKKGYDPKKSRSNIDAYLARKEDQREYWVRCLVNIAAENEHE